MTVLDLETSAELIARLSRHLSQLENDVGYLELEADEHKCPELSDQIHSVRRKISDLHIIVSVLADRPEFHTQRQFAHPAESSPTRITPALKE
jgi:hypothetical protein